MENCEAKVCSFKGAYLDPYRPGRESKQAPFCVEHHNQLVDLKVRRLPVAAFGAQQQALHLLGKSNEELSATLSLTGLPVQ